MLYWSLLLLPLLLRLVPGRGDQPWRTAVDVPLALTVGTLSGLLCGVWLVQFYLRVGNVEGSPDFLEYCWSTGAFLYSLGDHISGNRSRAAGLLSGLLARRLGVLDGLLWAAILSTSVLSAACHLWARSLHSRTAGILAGLAVSTVPCLCVLSRTLTYYPPIIATLVLCAAAGTVAMRWRTVVGCAVAGLGAGLALLIDARGLPWALVTVSLGGLAALVGHRGTRLRAPLRLLALGLPLVWSFQVGPWAFPDGAASLVSQVSVARDLRRVGVYVDDAQIPERPSEGFVWGRSSLLLIPDTLVFVSGQSVLITEEARAGRTSVDKKALHVTPWVPLVSGAALLAVLGLVRQPLLLFAALASALPFVLSLDSAIVVKQSGARFLANAAPFVPLVLGLAGGVLAGRRGLRVPGVRGDGLRLLAVLVLGVLVVLGVVPTFLSPVAPWRVSVDTSQRAVERARDVVAGTRKPKDPADTQCASVLATNPEDGRWVDLLTDWDQ